MSNSRHAGSEINNVPTAHGQPPSADVNERPADSYGLVTKPDVAKYLKVTVRTVDAWMKKGIIPYKKLARSVRFDLERVKAHIEEFHTVSRRSINH
jgi:excisionase family DNA binding protein